MKKPNIDQQAKKIMVDREVYESMMDALINTVENIDKYGEIYPHNYGEMRLTLKKAGVEL